MEIVGRVTADAKVTRTKSEKEVVNFTVAVNESYRTKQGEQKQLTNYFKCAYWRTAAVAAYLKKGIVIHVWGRIGVEAFIGQDGKAKGQLTIHVDRVKWFAKNAAINNAVSEPAASTTEPVEDLPF
jgi:single-strand DNA-binding protein